MDLSKGAQHSKILSCYELQMLMMDRLGPTEIKDEEKGVVHEVSVDTQLHSLF